MNRKKIFISRDLDEDNHLIVTLKNEGYEVETRALTKTFAVDFDSSIFPTVDWIFFSSKNSVEFFFKKNLAVGKARLAAIGQGTAKVLSKYGTVGFIGQTNKTEEVARDFARKAGKSVVLFPMSDRSLRTVQRAMPEEQVHDLIVYRTEERGFSVGNHDVLVFTSPSNAEAFLSANTIGEQQKVVAFGKSTGAFLSNNGIRRVHISKGTSDEAIVSAIKKALDS
ncbi:MAG: uroporphyrinogen-III synthase [Crocinitomicaceae bacterium]|nr:uroporphyrinogen-III synthase [Crocinitomicaceae bacterium]